MGYHVGITEPVEEITQLLALEDNGDVRMVCIYGMDGIGKTTLAKAVYKHISAKFQACSFLEEIKARNLCGCQEQLLKDIVNYEKEIRRITKGKTLLSKRLPCKKALIILDDVNDEDKVDALAGEPNWFATGSRIIITSTNQDMHTYHKFRSRLQVYLIKKLSEEHSLELLSYHAFDTHQSEPGYEGLLKEVTSYACNLPLALQLLGGLLRLKREKSEWGTSIGRWTKSITGDIKQILELSYKGIQGGGHENIFLDIACFYIGMNSEIASYIWDNGVDAIRALSNRCLIRINDGNKLEMHDLIRDMGRTIAQHNSRMCEHLDVMGVLNDKEKKKRVEGVRVRSNVAPKSTVKSPKKSRRVLRLSSISFRSELGHLPHNQRWMEWHGSLLKSLSSLELQNVVVLDVSQSKMTRIRRRLHPWKCSWQDNHVGFHSVEGP